MLGVYSTRVFTGWLSEALNTEFLVVTVPTDRTLIIESLHADQTAAAGNTVYLALGAGGPILARYVPSASGVIEAVRQHIVLHGGEQLYSIVQGAGARGSINGYLLLGSPPPLTTALIPQPTFPLI